MNNLDEYTVEELRAEIERRKWPFKKGDLVYVRDFDYGEWFTREFDYYVEEDGFPFRDKHGAKWKQCKPYDKTYIAWRYDVENMPENGNFLVRFNEGVVAWPTKVNHPGVIAYAVLPELPEIKK